jgi:hypothetical protein
MLLAALSLTTTLAACGPEDVAGVRRNLPPPAAVCTRDVPLRYPAAGENWRTVALRTLQAAETLHGHRKACADWYTRLRARYAKG